MQEQQVFMAGIDRWLRSLETSSLTPGLEIKNQDCISEKPGLLRACDSTAESKAKKSTRPEAQLMHNVDSETIGVDS
jgi:hypothetical protein